ncbi:MAG: hypothetical protein ABGZ53_09970 [Fuerstiella sp.]|jgi:hypothetical protein
MSIQTDDTEPVDAATEMLSVDQTDADRSDRFGDRKPPPTA